MCCGMLHTPSRQRNSSPLDNDRQEQECATGGQGQAGRLFVANSGHPVTSSLLRHNIGRHLKGNKRPLEGNRQRMEGARRRLEGNRRWSGGPEKSVSTYNCPGSGQGGQGSSSILQWTPLGG